MRPHRTRRREHGPQLCRSPGHSLESRSLRGGGTIEERIIASVAPDPGSPARIGAEFRRRLAAGMALRPAGEARSDPTSLLVLGYTPKHRLRLFDTEFYLTNVLQNADIRFFVGYVVMRNDAGGECAYPRIFYKDLSLIWRSASHLIRSENENWIGKGDVEVIREDGREYIQSVEQTTDLPFEIQTALETISRGARRIPYDDLAQELVLRSAPDDRIEPYRDFTEPRRRASADPRNRVYGGRRVAWFARANDPSSLRFAPGFAPDLAGGVLEQSRSSSRLYGGRLERFRVLSQNRRIQYLFFAGPHQVWLIPPQRTTTELSSYGVRTIDVPVHEDLCVPGYEYHFVDEYEDPPVLVSQIPPGFAGQTSAIDPYRADASPWLDRLPIVQAFRRARLGKRKR